MGIHGIYKEIGPGRRVALSKLSAEHYIAHSRPFRLAIDISIWLFQIQSGKGGSNPALRTFYYRLLRLLSLNIHPLFVFDGPNKPTFKRHKKVGGPNVKVSSIPEFLAKQLLKHFGFPIHHAPGEAEAECALLQREGIVDAVLSEDVDTLMFGSGLTLRSWTPEAKSSKVPTHVNVYDAETTKEGSGLDRPGMILIAMMSGGDYIPEGIPGCGPKLACEAARAGFGADLCSLRKGNLEAINAWRERLRHEIRTNESKFFKQKRTTLVIPDDFPNREVLGYYTHPVVSGPERIAKLKDDLKWDMPLDYPSLRDFAADAFDWRCLGGAKKFVRNLAPAILIRELRLRGESADIHHENLDAQEEAETDLIAAIHGKRSHVSTDNTPELRVSFIPIQLVNIDLSVEDPDEELPPEEEDSESEPPASQQVPNDGDECPGSPKKKRALSAYDPTVHEKAWLLDTWVRLGAPLKVQDWEGAQQDALLHMAAKQAAKANGQTKSRKKVTKNPSGVQRGTLDKFTEVIGLENGRPSGKKSASVDEVDLSNAAELPRAVKNIVKPVLKETSLNGFAKITKAGINRSSKLASAEVDEIDLSKINAMASVCLFTASKTQTSSSLEKSSLFAAKVTADGLALSKVDCARGPRRASKRPSPEPQSPYASRSSEAIRPRKVTKQHEIIEILSSSPVPPIKRKETTPPPPDIRHLFRRDESYGQVLDIPNLPDTVTRRRKKSPSFKRYQSAPTAGEDLDSFSPSVRPSTPPLIDTVEAMDLASPAVIPSSPDSLPSPTLFRRGLKQPAATTSAPRSRATMAIRADEICSSGAHPHGTITALIRTRQSLTPTEGRAAAAVGVTAAIPLDLSSPILTPTLEEVEKGSEDDVVSISAPAPRQEVLASALLPFNKRFRDRQHQLANPDASVPSITSPRDLPTALAIAHSAEIDQGRISRKAKKRYIQPRDSLPGRWKEVEVEVEVEHMDLSTDTSAQRRDAAGRRLWRKSAVEMVDLTGD